MSFYIVRQPAHVTYYVKVVEADNPALAREAAGDTDGIGWYDAEVGDDLAPDEEVSGPFLTKGEALADDRSWTEGNF